MLLTRDMLIKHSACGTGLRAFDAAFPNGADLAEWTREKQIEIMRSPLGQYVGWAAQEGLLPLWSMNGANLNGANLDRASLDGANLNGANLDRANLNGASLVRASLVRANLNGASLNGASLVRASLNGASLNGASLNGANLNGAWAGYLNADSLAVLSAAGWSVVDGQCRRNTEAAR